jgi:hypothetical protein
MHDCRDALATSSDHGDVSVEHELARIIAARLKLDFRDLTLR